MCGSGRAAVGLRGDAFDEVRQGGLRQRLEDGRGREGGIAVEAVEHGAG
jgi:hypothetical protein